MEGGNVDIVYNPDIITSVLGDMELQLEKKCEQLQKDADFMCTSMQRTFHLELIKLPSQVKKMSLKKFKNEYGESLEAVTKSTIGGKSRAMMAGASSTTKSSQSTTASRTASSSVYATPSHKHSSSIMAPNTSSRVPKEGETILSSNGSPLGEYVSTVVKEKKNFNPTPATPGADHNNTIVSNIGGNITLGDGAVLDLENGGVSADIDTMSQATKTEALEKMEAMMENMKTLMAKFQK